MPSLLKWDDGTSMTSEDVVVVLERVRAALRERSERYKLIESDDVFPAED